MSSQFEHAAPEPLKSLTVRVVSPENIATEARHKRAEPLTLRERLNIKAQIKRLTDYLTAQQYEDLQRVEAALKDDLAPLMEAYNQLKTHVESHPDDQQAADYFAYYQTELEPQIDRMRVVRAQLEPLKHVARERNTLQVKLDDHPIATARLKEEKRLRQEMEKEAKIYERLIITRWTRLGYCHRYTEKGKEKTDVVKFSRISITLDAIYYKISASHKTAFNNWDSDVPEGVFIAKQLLAPETLSELSITCQKQVTGEYNANGAWVIVHRLESVDGLMNYVSFKDVMERYPEQDRHKMVVPVGVTYNREIRFQNIIQWNNWLIGGYTGSGKSNIVNVKVCSLIMTQSPKELRLVLIDLKGGLEFDLYEGIPHLHGKIVTEISDVADKLAELEAIMEARFKKMRGVAKDITTYNLKRPGEPMPHILCMFDEVASIQGHGNLTKQIVASILSLTRLGRAVGIHTDLCTQQPNVKVIEGGIKTNMNLTLSGRMPTSSASVTVLGNSSAANLAAIAGRMMLQDGPDPIPVQTPHIDMEAIAAALKIAKSFPTPEPLAVGEIKRVISQQWTPEMIIDFSLTHLDGLVSGRRVHESIGDEALSRMQANNLVEAIWAMSPITHNDKIYVIQKRRGGARYLVEQLTEDSKMPEGDNIPIQETSQESSLETLDQTLEETHV